MEYLLLVGIVQAIFTTVFLVSKRERALSDKILAVWMVFIALPLIGGAVIRLWPEIHFPILRSDLIYPLTYGPFMWLYVRALTGEVSGFAQRELVHFLPFVAVSLFQLSTGWAPVPPNPEMGSFDTATRIVGAINLASMLSYSAVVALRLRQHGKEVVRHFSNLSNRVTLAWLCWLTAGISTVFLLLFLASVLSLPDLLRIHLPAQIIIILALSFFGLRQVQVFDRRQEFPMDRADQDRSLIEGVPRQVFPELSEIQTPEEVKERYSRSGLTEERAEKISRKLDAYMETERPYLSPDLTIAELGKRMGVSRHHLTEVISTRHKKNFYVFVNEYRIEAVKQAMQDPKNSDMTLLDLAYAVGFNSKAPFNAAFKRLTGMVPSQYRNQLS